MWKTMHEVKEVWTINGKWHIVDEHTVKPNEISFKEMDKMKGNKNGFKQEAGKWNEITSKW